MIRVRSLRPPVPPVTVLVFRDGLFHNTHQFPGHCAALAARELVLRLGPGFAFRLPESAKAA